jgi:hypothetical protein
VGSLFLGEREEPQGFDVPVFGPEEEVVPRIVDNIFDPNRLASDSVNNISYCKRNI